ncbi:serine/threonine-protein kinase [Bryobacter aggregatus]|uniref:serine/threonine-protein kinase n=1 Tax=Bryobacter aggregatus TaxID=360054 RepID=UPI000690A2D5|nr:serine/threonine-protein kinase [Bryobacter aggregatus]
MDILRASSGGAEASPSPGTYKLPPALLEKTAARLCWISTLCAVATVVVLGLECWLQPEFATAFRLLSNQLAMAGVLLLSLGFLTIQRKGWVSKQALLDLGIVFQSGVAFAISIFETSIPWDPSDPVLGHSGVAIWLALCGLLLPNAPLKSLLAAALSCLAWPAAYVLNLHLHGYTPLPWNRLLIWILPIVVMAVWMYVLNARIFAMQWKQVKAEEMGSYKLDYLIGKGGMGEVWRAKHTMLARDAAVKLIRGDVLAEASGKQGSLMRQRFEREAKATASLRSPHTVALYDYGRTKDETYYYVMEMLDGIDLQTIVERFGPMPPGRVVKVLQGVAASLEEAHHAGMVHRDIKPKNLVMAKIGVHYDFIKVLDFGLVKTRVLDGEANLLTMDGIATGTPAYLPPEIALGEEGIDGRADLYSLGCVAYYLLTGQLVFAEPTPTAMALAHVQKTPVLPSIRLGAQLSPGLEQIVMDLLEKKPANRIQSARELLRRLRALDDVKEWCEDAAADWWKTHLPDAESKKAAVENDEIPTAAGIGLVAARG